MSPALPPVSPPTASAAAVASVQFDGVSARVDATDGAGQVRLTGVVQTERPFVGRYEFEAAKVGGPESSTTRQAGPVATTAAGQPISLPALALDGLGAGERWRATLMIFQGDRMMARVETQGAF